MLKLKKALALQEEQLQRALSVRLVSITLDPENDTPDVLRAYAEGAGADDTRWSFLSGRSEDLDRVVVRGFKSSYERVPVSAGIGTIRAHGSAVLGMSYEIANVTVPNQEAMIWAVTDFTFTGAAVLRRDKAAYPQTWIAVPANNSSGPAAIHNQSKSV